MKRKLDVVFIAVILGVVLVMYGQMFSKVATDSQVLPMVAVIIGIAITLALESMVIIKATKS